MKHLFVGRCLLALAFHAVAPGQVQDLGPAVRLEEPAWPAAAAIAPKNAAVERLAAGSWFDTSNRSLVAAAYLGDYASVETFSMEFTGNVAAGQAGTTSPLYRAAALARATWFRRMAGLPGDLALDTELSRKAQLGALMLGANGTLSHTPPPSWFYYTADGADALDSSNICYWWGNQDPGCVALYIQDHGASNYVAGHRRWLLSPKINTIGTGDVIDGGGRNWNALWVIPVDYWSRPRAATRDEFVAWPPRGYVPYQVVWPRWSFSLPAANFSSATVTMIRSGSSVPVRLEQVVNGYGDDTLVWVPDGQNADLHVSNPAAPASDTPVQVTISNVLVGGIARSYSYTVIVFDPASQGGVFSVSPTSAQLAAAGGSGALTVTNPAGVAWTATSGATWLTVTYNTTAGTVNYSAGANPSVNARSAVITVGTTQATITQPGSPPVRAVQPASASVGAAAGSGSFNVNVTPADASWSVTATSGSITITSATSGTGNGVVTYGYPANTSTQSRVATVTISNGPAFSLAQAGSSVPPPVPGGEALRFVPVTPCRVADTRNAAGPFGAPHIAANTTRSFPIASSTCGIPATARAYSLNVTVVPRGMLGYLSLWPTGQSQPLVSTLNSLDGRIKANAAIVPAGTGGAVSVYAQHAADVILDINGYFVPATDATALAFYPLTPCRVADTREAARGLLGTPNMRANQSRSFPVLSSACGIPASARAYSLNFTVVPRGMLGYLSTWPTGQTQPWVSTLNALTGTVTANAAIVPAGNGGAIDVFAQHDSDLIIDINGYFAPPGTGGLSLYNVTPCRVFDTRVAVNAPVLNGTRAVNFMSSTCALPTAARAYAVNATVVPPSFLGFISLWPQGAAQPWVSTLNATDAAITSNMAIVPTNNGSISAYASSTTDLILDISGYFAP